ncbi:ATP-binding protein [Nonomuraea sp. NPDC050783]|uniref:ATP-binding protein n=1 Tax=Nonomuraea sp. NPDC050783 TaxID=3154634 RepID=UPI003466A6D2
MVPTDFVLWRSTTLRRNPRVSWQARQAVGLWLADAEPGVRSDALQIVAELVANVLQHVPGGPGRDWVGVRLGFGGGFVRVEVIDPGVPDPGPCFVPRQVGALAEAGRGLGIVASLSAGRGTRLVAGGRRVVWADVAAG